MVGIFSDRMKVVILSVLLLLPSLVFANINVSIDREPVALDESFQIVFETNESVGEPDFGSLKNDFDILSTRQSSNTTIINGRMERSKKWILDVMAKRQGKLVIPSIRFGKKKSEALLIAVKKAGKTKGQNIKGDVFFEVEINSKKPYVQEQVLYTVRLFLATSISNASLSEPSLKGADAVVQKLGDDKQYETRRGNRRYSVYERQYAIFPQVSGKIEIEPLTFQGQTGAGSRYFGNIFDQSGKMVVRRTDPVTLDVQTIPMTSQGQQWLPAKNLELKESWPATSAKTPPGALPTFHVGEPITRTITLQAEGLTASQLPELRTELSDDFKQYPDQPALHDQVTENGINGIRIEKMAIIPGKEGKYTLPEMVIPWWNVNTDQQEYARLPERVVSVLPAIISRSGEPHKKQTEGVVPQDTEVNGQNTKKTKQALQPLDAGEAPENNNTWIELSIFLGIGWLLTIFIWLWFHFRKSHNNNIEEVELSLRKVMAQLKRACAENDPVSTKNAILNWARHHWPDDHISSLGDVSKRCDRNLGAEIETVSRLLYSKEKQAWNGKKLWNAINEFQRQSTKSQKKITSKLEPLYRL